MTNKHQPEPWRHTVWTNGWQFIDAANGNTVIGDDDYGAKPDPSLARAVACVNACKGLNPEAIPELIEACGNLSESMTKWPTPLKTAQHIKEIVRAIQKVITHE